MKWVHWMLAMLCGIVLTCDGRAELLQPARTAVGNPHWKQGAIRGQAGWFIVRTDAAGRDLVYAEDQPSGRREPCFLHKRSHVLAPLDDPGRRDMVGAVNYGVNIGELARAPSSGEVLTNDPQFGQEIMQAMQDQGQAPAGPDGNPCPGPGPCPSPQPDPSPDLPGGGGGGLEGLRPYAVPLAAAVLVAVGLVIVRRRAS